ncbi:MAG: response regulator transcription factor [Spirochaetales bacterium]|nr:response regulator transcription factor [Spirochaetales bacterium]
MKPIAIVDDEKNIREMITFALAKENYPCIEYGNGEEAWFVFREEMPELIILDIMMPRMDGMELCRRIRSIDTLVPIIFLSSRDDEIDKVLGLESGGDDYVCKPFGMRELISRVRAALRRKSPPEALLPADPADKGNQEKNEPGLICGDLIIDQNRYVVSWKNVFIPLTVTEFRILENLVLKPGYVKSREQLMQAAFPDDNYVNDRAADSHIKRIRRKICVSDPNFNALESIYGIGYRFNRE